MESVQYRFLDFPTYSFSVLPGLINFDAPVRESKTRMFHRFEDWKNKYSERDPMYQSVERSNAAADYIDFFSRSFAIFKHRVRNAFDR